MTAHAVIGHPQTRAFRVMWMLEELDLSYEIEPVGPHSERAREANPASGKVPALLIDGAAYTDSAAIVQHLADRHGGATFPAGSLERLTQDGHAHFVLDEMDGALWTAAKAKFALPEDRRVPAIAATCAWEYGRALERLAARLGEGPWLMGEVFTVPDLLAGHCLDWGRVAFRDVEPPEAVAAYRGRLKAREGYRRAAERTKAIVAAA